MKVKLYSVEVKRDAQKRGNSQILHTRLFDQLGVLQLMERDLSGPLKKKIFPLRRAFFQTLLHLLIEIERYIRFWITHGIWDSDIQRLENS